MATSRRDFIRTVLLASGTVFTSWDDLQAVPAGTKTRISSLNYAKAHTYFRDKAARPAFPSSKKKVDVVVIGGGPAGLAAAWRLQKEGKEVLILENEPHVGGTMHSPPPVWMDTPYPLGASFFYEFTGSSADWYKSLGAEAIPTGEDALFITPDDITVDWWNPLVNPKMNISPADKEAFRRFVATMQGLTIPTYPLRTASKDVVREHDAVRAQSFIRDFGSEFLMEALNLYSLSTFGAPLSDVNMYAFLAFYARELGIGPSGKCLTFPGGMGEIGTRAAKIMGKGVIRPNATAVNVTNYDDGTCDVNYIDTLTGEPSTVTGHAVMLCMSKRIASALVPDLPAARLASMRAVRYAPYITLTLCCNGPLFSKRAFSFWLGDRQRLFTDVIDVTAASDAAAGNPNRMSGSFVYQMCCPRPENERSGLEQEAWLATFAQRAIDALSAQVQDVRDRVVEMHVFAWGHSLCIPAVGSYQAILPDLVAPFGHVYFTGADSDLAPSINNAVDAALDTAEQLITLLK